MIIFTIVFPPEASLDRMITRNLRDDVLDCVNVTGTTRRIGQTADRIKTAHNKRRDFTRNVLAGIAASDNVGKLTPSEARSRPFPPNEPPGTRTWTISSVAVAVKSFSNVGLKVVVWCTVAPRL